ncbi:MAG: CDP-2,3-bis-(O-geranylgeranyl)-sn-glycerol synthase [Saccharolobus sp.]|uniref:CDP-archaeol synthase n=2 Tax=Saccharolobus shibatae TaxID=2286 RepID=A0A8F5C2V6_9CREN|nr:CDP-2,3-bis-(O-geranylgeranyl)-sn-glycerol synthase [Saccharolobus shibatae]MCH4814993.1 CDP-2,3-bis-(O-geranylgeranyl)-sn-glycerol synthase [Saccharolobus shibatae]QXJ29749.1 CDP-2,3-bis-(O-geranylgeranyl)-sn-glycerol synthase [Saccharolobus shibatae B12]QXJ32971.1 CDP-2,3-bis-(O-geranylgeranyl)-sn-glycerol synthase [Saccharolobus shibatae]QXJ36102.1 CDP-2,3-bis-(O-geranylgeranyl)-sn-glycerol synthase [Saccharolobus shibatae]
MSIAYDLLLSILIYLPAFVANGSGPFIKRGTPIDFGKNFVDGRRVFGDGKTFEGLIIALTFGTTVGVIISKFFTAEWILISFLESLFAMIGDMIGAFIKRRLGIPRGGRVLGLDQLDFVLGASLILVLIRVNITWYQFLFICLLAFFLHQGTNYVAYLLKIKNVPW